MPRTESKDLFNPDLADTSALNMSVSDSRYVESLLSPVQEADGIYLYDRRF